MMSLTTAKKQFLIREKNIPVFLKQFPHWLVWKYERAAGDKPGAKPRKMPYYPGGGRRRGVLGSDKDVANLGSFKTAMHAARTGDFDGVGLAILPEQDITVIDLDNCINSDGVYSEFADTLVQSGSYVERSPSGRGLRAVYARALVHDAKRNFHVDNGERVEVYCGQAYTTFTGARVGPTLDEDESPLITTMPRSIKRRLLAGMGDRVSGDESARGDASGEGALASMNAVALPNMTPEQAGRVLAGLPDRWGNEGEGTWFQVAAALHMQFDGSEEAYAVLDAWSQDRTGYDAEGNRARWDAGFSHAQGKQNVLSMRNLVFEARDAGVKFRDSTLASWGLARRKAEPAASATITGGNAAADGIELPDDAASEEVQAAWRPIDLSEWSGRTERPRGTPALIPGWLTDENVALFSASGGEGKSFIALTLLAFAAAGGKQWFGEDMVQGRCVYVSAEDPKKDVLDRLWGICELNGLDRRVVAANLDIIDVSNLLERSLYAAGDFGKAAFTKQYDLLEQLLREGAEYKYAVLDNASEFFAGNENSRNHVVSFVGSLKRLAMEYRLGIVLIGHTAKATDSTYSGSTAWHNSTRVRWTAARDAAMGGTRLTVERITHSRHGKAGLWRWDDAHHTFAMGENCGADSGSAEFAAASLPQAVEEAVLEITANGGRVSAAARGPLGVIEQHPGVLDVLGRMGIQPKEYNARIRQCLVDLAEQKLIEVREYKATNRSTKNCYEICVI